MRKLFQWYLGTRQLELGRRTLLMGIVTLTPDSFSDADAGSSGELALSGADWRCGGRSEGGTGAEGSGGRWQGGPGADCSRSWVWLWESAGGELSAGDSF